MKLKTSRDLVFKILNWMMIPILGSLSYFFVIEAWNDYRLGKTNMSYDEIPIQGQPTVVICPDILNKDDGLKYIQELMYEGKLSLAAMDAEVYYYTLDGKNGEIDDYKSIHLEEGSNSFGNETITLQKMQHCYAIKSESNGQYQHEDMQIRYIKVVVPTKARAALMTIKAYFTTEENSFAPEFGLHLSEEIVDLKLRLSDVNIELWGFVELGGKLTKYIKEKSGCREESSWKLIQPSFVSSVNEKCGTGACVPKGFPFSNIDLRTCDNFNEYDCPSRVLKKLLKTDQNANTVPCTKLEYHGSKKIYWIEGFRAISEELFWDNYHIGKGNYLIQFNFKQPEIMALSEEYYVVQTLDLIGIVGGTLGLFVEFTFYHLFSFFLNVIQPLASKVKMNGTKSKMILSMAFKAIDWICFLILGILAIVFSKESIDAYSDGKTTWMTEQQPLQTHPTFTLCFGLSQEAALHQKIISFGQDFNLFFTASSQSYPLQLEMKDNGIPDLINESIDVQFLTVCYKVVPKVGDQFNSFNGDYRTLSIEFGNHLNIEQLPIRAIFYATSYENSFGAEIGHFTNGKPHVTEILLNHHAFVSFKAKKIQYLKEKRVDCEEETFWEVVGDRFVTKVKEMCPNPCYHIGLPKESSLPSCVSKENEVTMDRLCAEDSYKRAMIETDDFNFKPCSIEEFEGIILDNSKIKGKPDIFYWDEVDQLDSDVIPPKSAFSKNPGNVTIKFSYKFDLPEKMSVVVESYVATFFDLIGIVGGTLGLFIGFAFFDSVLTLTDYFIAIYKLVKGKRTTKVKDVSTSMKSTKHEGQIKEKESKKEVPKPALKKNEVAVASEEPKPEVVPVVQAQSQNKN